MREPGQRVTGRRVLLQELGGLGFTTVIAAGQS